jgi:hypothetical protein
MLEKRMSAKQVAEAQRLSAQFVPRINPADSSP